MLVCRWLVGVPHVTEAYFCGPITLHRRAEVLVPGQGACPHVVAWPLFGLLTCIICLNDRTFILLSQREVNTPQWNVRCCVSRRHPGVKRESSGTLGVPGRRPAGPV